MWSDPDLNRKDFAISPRGAGYTFGADIVSKFLYVNDMDQILRAHQLCMEGFQVLYDSTFVTGKIKKSMMAYISLNNNLVLKTIF